MENNGILHFMNEAAPNVINNISILITIAGFFITVYVSFGIKELKGKFRRKVRLPEIINFISDQTSVLIIHINEFDEENSDKYNHSKTIVSKLKSPFESLYKILDRKQKSKVKQLDKKIKNYVSSRLPKDERKEALWGIHNEAIELVHILESINKDEQWS